ncbi:hypothetical protein TorRG33x02_259390, partial [Trema orientale]
MTQFFWGVDSHLKEQKEAVDGCSACLLLRCQLAIDSFNDILEGQLLFMLIFVSEREAGDNLTRLFLTASLQQFVAFDYDWILVIFIDYLALPPSPRRLLISHSLKFKFQNLISVSPSQSTPLMSRQRVLLPGTAECY